MQFLSYRPVPPLADFVDQLWLSQGAAPAHEMERLLPDSTVELVINLHQDRIHLYDRDDYHRCGTVPGCMVSGPRTQYFVIDTQDQGATLGVHFRPGGAFLFLRGPASDLVDQSVALDALWGSAAADLRERLLAVQRRKASSAFGSLPPGTVSQAAGAPSRGQLRYSAVVRRRAVGRRGRGQSGFQSTPVHSDYSRIRSASLRRCSTA